MKNRIAVLIGLGILSLSFNLAYGFTQDSPPVTLDTSATFTQVSAQIFQPLCLKCHSTGDHEPDLSSYDFATNTNWVVPGNPQASVLYQKVASGEMPKHGTPLTSDQLQLISDWISSGALDN